MTTTNGTVGDQIEGLVESANDHGIKVAGEWRNVSKFKPIDLPDRGARVRCELDAKGFLRSVQILDGAPSSTSPSSSSTRDRTITRLAVLKAARQLPRSDGPIPRGRPFRSCARARGEVARLGRRGGLSDGIHD